MNNDPSSFRFSPHRDVLEAPIPLDAVSKEILKNELKNRAKGAVATGAWPDAAALYDKALQVIGEENDGDSNNNNQEERAILYSNLALVHGKMQHWQRSLELAQAAVNMDGSYTKAWWRLGQAHAALQQYDPAIQALEKGLQTEPSNKVLAKELEKLKQQQAKSKAGAAAAPSTSSTSRRPAAPMTTTSTTTSKASTSTSASEQIVLDNDDGDGTTFTKSDHIMKGYKLTKDGKKTSYFTTELSDDAKQLIGDIRPKKLDETVATNTAATTTTTTNTTTTTTGTSAWNQAGTWEEKDVTAWACQSLQDKCQGTTYTADAADNGSSTMTVAQVAKANVTGTASVATVRGKKRYLYEMAVTIEWTLVQKQSNNNNDNDVIIAKGQFKFPDIDGTCPIGEPYEATDYTVIQEVEKDGAARSRLLPSMVYPHGLREELNKSIDDWVRLFRETY